MPYSHHRSRWSGANQLVIAINDRPALQGIHKPGVINDARNNAMGDLGISLERSCSRVVQWNQSGGNRLVNTVELSGKIAHAAHSSERHQLQVISDQAGSLPACLMLGSARTLRIHNWTEAESNLLGPSDGVPLLSHCS